MIEKSVKLYLGDGFPVRIPVSQYDTMWRFVFSIINGSVEWEIPSGATAVLNGRKPDGNVIAISGAIANNKVTVDATEQMTVVAGEVVCELSIMSGGAVVGTANFTLAVEDAPKKNGEAISESDLSAYAEMIEAAGELVEAAQEIIEQGPFLPPGGTPGQVLTKTANGEEWGDVSGLPDGGSNGQVLTKHGDGAEWSDAGTPTQAQTNTALADYLDEHPEAVTNIPDRIKQALLACFQKVAWVDANGQTYYDALYDALMNKEVLSIAAVFTQGSATIYDTDSLDDLKQYLTVTASYDDGTTGEVTAYELSGTLTEGTSTITVTYDEKTTAFDVVVTASLVPAGYTAYDYIRYTGADGQNQSPLKFIKTKKFDNLNNLIIDFDFMPYIAMTGSTAGILGGQPQGTSGNSNMIAFYGRTDTQRVSVFSHGSAIGINDNPNVVQGKVAHVRLNPGTSSPSTLAVDSLSATAAWTDSNVINSELGYCGKYVSGTGNYSTLKNFAAIGTLRVYDLSGTLIGEYYPCVRDADNVMGIFDTVTETFYTAGTVSYATIGNSNCLWAVGNWEVE